MARICKTCDREFERLDKLGRSAGRECGSCLYLKYRLRKIEIKYGISPEEYLKMHSDQNGCCAICGIHESKLDKRLHTDHCHTTGMVRGLLCNKCNTSLGQFESDPELLLIAYEYLTGGESNQ
jgi:hypothetical protein